MPERDAWLERLPDAIRELQDRWSLSLGAPFDGGDVSRGGRSLAPGRQIPGTWTVL